MIVSTRPDHEIYADRNTINLFSSTILFLWSVIFYVGLSFLVCLDLELRLMKFESLILGLGIGLHFGLQRVGW